MADIIKTATLYSTLIVTMNAFVVLTFVLLL
ncbi:hypothetical protein ABID23_000825 [Bartonella silvatica]|uniref:Uncharacterized protein n=1 Tax=Bartonella silvatica TaxID=357760 RepID=A0ABV2HGQ7_9HYPH